MQKIEIIQQIPQPMSQNVLDIYQLKIISIYEELLSEENIQEYFSELNKFRYSSFFEIKNEKAVFTGCDSGRIDFIFFRNIHELFEWNLIFEVKTILTRWHLGRKIGEFHRKGFYNIVHPELTNRQRGVLTKILKIENKRKKQLSLM